MIESLLPKRKPRNPAPEPEPIPQRPALPPAPPSAVELCPVPAAPAPAPLESFPEYRTARERLDEITARERAALDRLRALEAEHEERRKSDRLGVAERLLDASRPLPQRVGATAAAEITSEHAALRREASLLMEAREAGERNLATIARKLSSRAAEPMMPWHRKMVEATAEALLRVAALWQSELDAYQALGDADIPAGGLCATGPCRPTTISPGTVAQWFAHRLDEGTLPREERYVRAAMMETGHAPSDW